MIEILVKSGNGNSYRALDINESVSFSITYEIATIQDIASSNGSYTKALQLPNTANNRKVFGFATDLATDLAYGYYSGFKNSFNPNKKVPCIVLEDSSEIMRGHIQLTNYSIDDIVHQTINVTIYADNANFYQSMGDSLLTDLDFSEYSFTYSQTVITNTWNNDADAYKKGYYFPLIDYGHGYTLDDVNNPLVYTIDVKDFLPAVFTKTIWDKIYSTHSINVQSKFTGSNRSSGYDLPDPRFGNLVIPFAQQAFQTGSTFSADKIFHVGIDNTTVGQYTTYSMDVYQSSIGGPGPGGGHIPGGGGSASGVAKAIFNAVAQPVDSVRYCWFDGYHLNPWHGHGALNTFLGTGSSTHVFSSQTIPFTLTASPMFDTSIGGVFTYDTSVHNYQNLSTTFKQRFVLNTDVVTTYSIDYNYQRGTDHDYVMYVEFFRECDPTTGVTHSGWAGGTGSIIPADLGGATNLCVDVTGATNSWRHYICDHTGKSNCFDKNGTLIVPTGSNKYLGKYCTTYRGDKCIEATNDGATYSPAFNGTQQQYPNNSGACITWYYNDATNQVDPTSGVPNDLQTGLWCSGFDNGDGSFGGQGAFPTDEGNDKNQASNHAAYGDWFQQLQLQTIYLDNNPNDIYYGATGSRIVNGNKALFTNEKVRCVVTFGSRYAGQQLTGSPTISFRSYTPPISCYLVTYTNFANDLPYPAGTYQNPQSLGKPLTQFWNDVSSDYINGQFVDFNDCIPKNVKQRDFVQSIIHMHNLYIEPHKKYLNTLIIEPREDYYDLSTSPLDWSRKVDLSQTINVQILANTQTKRTTFSYKNDNDWFNKLYTQDTNEIYGQFLFQSDNDYLTGDTKIETIFSPTPVSSLYSVFDNGDSLSEKGAFILPVLVNGSNVKPASNAGPQGAVQTNYRILLKKYVQNQNKDTIRIFGSATHSYPYAGPYDDPYTPAYTVNFGDTLGEFMPTPTDAVSNNLYNTYWSGLMSDMNDINSKIIECYMFLTPKDIFQFQFYNLVYVIIGGVGDYYKVNSITDYVPGKNSTCKVQLLKSNRLLKPIVLGGSIS